MTPSPRALQILTLTATGLTKQQIGAQLYITENTVKSHLEHAYKALDARNATHAVALALCAGLIPPPRRTAE